MTFYKFIIVLCAILYCQISICQDTINLKNPSFEDTPRVGIQGMPTCKGWEDCGRDLFPGEAPPDILPTSENGWGVTKAPSDGKTYLAMVVRATDTWESLTQHVVGFLKAGMCYSFSAKLAISNVYESRTKASYQSGQKESFVHPVIFEIWGGLSACDRMELLAESPPVENFDWQLFEFVLSPKRNYTYFTIKVYYTNDRPDKYNGHMLIDDLSPIVEIQCK